ncbi:MAG: ABC transporter substrate-binding protein [Chloroflexi bacterium]|nr:ABC transporter substrate-binding protein [Chloroflexota bacterium]
MAESKRLLQASFHRDPRTMVEELVAAERTCYASWELSLADAAWTHKEDVQFFPRPSREWTPRPVGADNGCTTMKYVNRILTLAASVALGGSLGCSVLGNSQGQSTGPIKIGMVTSLTGNYAPLGTNDKLAAQQIVDAVNAKNGINGRKIELDIVDDGSDPNQSVIQFNKVIGDGVVAVLGPPQSTADLAIKPVANDKKMPTISLGAADEQVVPVTPYMWMTAPLSSQVAKVCVDFMKSQGKAKLAMLSDTKNAYAVSGHDATKKILDQAGVQLVEDETFETTQTNFAPQFAKIVDARPDFLLVWATGAPPVVITKGWADVNAGIPLMMTAAEASTLYAQPAGAAAEGVFVQASIMPDSTNLMTVIKGGQFVPAPGLSDNQLAKAGQ